MERLKKLFLQLTDTATQINNKIVNSEKFSGRNLSNAEKRAGSIQLRAQSFGATSVNLGKELVNKIGQRFNIEKLKFNPTNSLTSSSNRINNNSLKLQLPTKPRIPTKRFRK